MRSGQSPDNIKDQVLTDCPTHQDVEDTLTPVYKLLWLIFFKQQIRSQTHQRVDLLELGLWLLLLPLGTDLISLLLNLAPRSRQPCWMPANCSSLSWSVVSENDYFQPSPRCESLVETSASSYCWPKQELIIRSDHSNQLLNDWVDYFGLDFLNRVELSLSDFLPSKFLSQTKRACASLGFYLPDSNFDRGYF